MSCDGVDPKVFRVGAGSVITVKVESDGDGFVARGKVTVKRAIGDLIAQLKHSDLIAGAAVAFDDGVEAVSFSLTVCFPCETIQIVRVIADVSDSAGEAYCRQIEGKDNVEISSVITAVI